MSKKLIMAAAAAADKDNDTLQLPLRTWMDIETKNKTTTLIFSHKESIVRKTTIAYGILELLLRCFKTTTTGNNSMPPLSEDDIIHTDNFTVLISSRNSSQHQPSWDDITGMTMKSPKLLSLTIEEPAYLTCLFEPDETHGQLGRYLEVEHHDHDMSSSVVVQEEEDSTTAVVPTNAEAMTKTADLRPNGNNKRMRVNNNQCYYLVAKVLYELFANEAFREESSSLATVNEAATTTIRSTTDDVATVSSEEPAQKKLKSSSSSNHHHRKLLSPPAATKGDFHKAKQLPFQIPSIVRMQQQLGIPASLCRMTQNLLEAASLSRGDNDDDNTSFNDAYKSLRDVAEDLHLLLLDPDRFLFDNEVQQQGTNDEITTILQLRYRKDKLYGRDKEETLITDAFCRVSRGKSEAFFIGGFSGCGKSMLVNSLRARVNVVGGYVIQHKFDATVSQEERSLSGVISAVNQLCVMLKRRNAPPRLAKLAKKIRDEFGADVALLARILQNVSVLSPEFISPVAAAVEEEAGGDTMNARSVGFTLLRFLRLVSSPKHPIMVSVMVDCPAIYSLETFLLLLLTSFGSSSFWMTCNGLMILHLM